MSIKTMMSNMEKLEEANDNMNLFIKQTIEPLLFNCVFELNTIESMSQVELANKIENEIIPFIQNFKYLKYESPEEEKQDLIDDMKKGIKENPTLKKYLDKMIADGIDEDTALNIMLLAWQNRRWNDE